MKQPQVTPFRFLSNDEFLSLSEKDKAIYLNLASQEIELRQRTLREQMHNLVKEQPPQKG